jgi:hypothetical protein
MFIFSLILRRGCLPHKNRLQRYKKKSTSAILEIKKTFFFEKICSYQKKVVPLHPEL